MGLPLKSNGESFVVSVVWYVYLQGRNLLWSCPALKAEILRRTQNYNEQPFNNNQNTGYRGVSIVSPAGSRKLQ
jgi:hypothetical protein